MMDDGIYKENDNHDNDDNDNEEQMLMQTPHYPPAETYCCWDVMVISRCPQTIITVTSFFIAFPSFLVDIPMSPNYVSRNNFFIAFPLDFGWSPDVPKRVLQKQLFYRFPLFFGVFLVSLSVFFVPWNLNRLPQKNISVIPFFPSKPVIPFTCFPSLLVISLLIISTTSILIRKAFLSDFACTS